MTEKFFYKDVRTKLGLKHKSNTFLRNPVHFHEKKSPSMITIDSTNLNKRHGVVNPSECIHQPVNKTLSLNQIIWW